MESANEVGRSGNDVLELGKIYFGVSVEIGLLNDPFDNEFDLDVTELVPRQTSDHLAQVVVAQKLIPVVVCKCAPMRHPRGYSNPP